MKRGRRTEKRRGVGGGDRERAEKRSKPENSEERVLSFSTFGKKG